MNHDIYRHLAEYAAPGVAAAAANVQHARTNSVACPETYSFIVPIDPVLKYIKTSRNINTKCQHAISQLSTAATVMLRELHQSTRLDGTEALVTLDLSRLHQFSTYRTQRNPELLVRGDSYRNHEIDESTFFLHRADWHAMLEKARTDLNTKTAS